MSTNKIEGYSGIYLQENRYFVQMRKQVHIGGKFIGDIANAPRSFLVDSLRKGFKNSAPVSMSNSLALTSVSLQ